MGTGTSVRRDSHEKGIIARLFTSFEELEGSIESAKSALITKGDVPDAVFVRLGSYDDILTKQRKLAGQLASEIDVGNWDEVNRLVGLINGLSGMIRDDARAMLSNLSLNTDGTAPTMEEEAYSC